MSVFKSRRVARKEKMNDIHKWLSYILVASPTPFMHDVEEEVAPVGYKDGERFMSDNRTEWPDFVSYQELIKSYNCFSREHTDHNITFAALGIIMRKAVCGDADKPMQIKIKKDQQTDTYPYKLIKIRKMPTKVQLDKYLQEVVNREVQQAI
jgi:hypothetical protein